MSGIDSVRPVASSFSTHANVPDAPVGFVSTERNENGAIIRWTLPASVVFSCESETTLDLQVSGRGAVPIRLKLTDGPVIQVIYADRTPPQDFDNFRVFASGPAFARIELGGSTDRNGFFSFQTMPLKTERPLQAGEILLELTGI